jgi:hypothetical protein
MLNRKEKPNAGIRSEALDCGTLLAGLNLPLLSASLLVGICALG